MELKGVKKSYSLDEEFHLEILNTTDSIQWYFLALEMLADSSGWINATENLLSAEYSRVSISYRLEGGSKAKHVVDVKNVAKENNLKIKYRIVLGCRSGIDGELFIIYSEPFVFK